MKNELEDRNVTSSNLGAAKTFSFAPSAKAFKVFIDGIYSDKIRAVIRELWTNAYDAHILANKRDVQFNCTLPTLLNPELVIRDFGPSMDHETMMNNFTQAFLSSKDNSNDFVGSLGLGRLSAFAYTDSFNVNTYINGEKRDYVVFINADGIPELALLSTVSTLEPDGFEVRFPVKVSDCSAFWNAAKFTAVGFDLIPAFQNEDVPLFEKKISGNGWSSFNDLSGAYARQGCVIYPLDNNIIRELGRFDAILDMKGIVVNFPIGSIDYNASREALGYNDRTRKSIKEAFTRIEGALIEDAQKSINEAKTWSHAAIILRDLKDSGIHYSILNKLSYAGAALREYIDVNNLSLARHSISLYKNEIKRDRSSFHFSLDKKLGYWPRRDLPVFAFKKGTTIVSPRIIAQCEANKWSSAYTISYEDARGLERMKRIMGYPKIIHVEALPKPSAKKRTVSRAALGYAAAYKVTENTISKMDVLLADQGYYVLIDRGSICHTGTYQFQCVLKFLKKRGVTNFDEIFGITPSQEEKFIKAGWKAVIPELKKAVKPLLATQEIGEALFYSELRHRDLLIRDVEDIDIETIEKTLGKDHLLTKIVSEAFLIKGRRIEMDANIRTISNFADFKPSPIIDPKVQENEDRKKLFLALYPMLNIIRHSVDSYFNDSYIGEDERKIFLDYLSEVRYEDVQIRLAA